MLRLLIGLSAGLVCSSVCIANAQDVPRRGGVLTTLNESLPDTTDCHATTTVPTLQYLAPEYSVLLRYDAANYPKIEGDVAKSWTVSADALTYRFKLRPNIKFHDGSPLTANDVKASYDRIRNPPAGIVSVRRARFSDIQSIEVEDPLTVTFRISKPSAAMLGSFADPFSCIYSAARLQADPGFPAKNVMGSGPFQFVSYATGDTWTTKRFDGYFRLGQPYLDGVKIINVSTPAVVNALSGGQVDANFRFVSPVDRDAIVKVRGDKMVFQESVLSTVVTLAINTQRKPFDDVRVRQALTLSIDRRAGDAALSKITVLKGVGGPMRPGYELALPQAELEKLPGFRPDIAASRAEARRLLAEAGVPNLKLQLLNRSQANPYQALGVFLIDQFREIGVSAEQVLAEIGPWTSSVQAGNFDVAVAPNNSAGDDPTDQFLFYLATSSNNYSQNKDQRLVELFEQQKPILDVSERRKVVNEFERRLIENAYSLPLFWNQRIVPLASNVKGYHITPITAVGLDHGGIWLSN